MSLKAAVRTYLDTQGVYDADSIFYGSAHGNADAVMVLRDIGEHRLEPTRILLFPALSVYLRDTSENRAAVESKAWEVFNTFDLRKSLELDTGYRVSHVEPAGHPIDLGQDEAGNWAYSLTLNFALKPTLTI